MAKLFAGMLFSVFNGNCNRISKLVLAVLKYTFYEFIIQHMNYLSFTGFNYELKTFR